MAAHMVEGSFNAAASLGSGDTTTRGRGPAYDPTIPQEMEALEKKLIEVRKQKAALTSDNRYNQRVNGQIADCDKEMKRIRARISVLGKLSMEQEARRKMEEQNRIAVAKSIRESEYDVVGKGVVLTAERLNFFAEAKGGELADSNAERMANMKAVQEMQRAKMLAATPKRRPFTAPDGAIKRVFKESTEDPTVRQRLEAARRASTSRHRHAAGRPGTTPSMGSFGRGSTRTLEHQVDERLMVPLGQSRMGKNLLPEHNHFPRPPPSREAQSARAATERPSGLHHIRRGIISRSPRTGGGIRDADVDIMGAKRGQRSIRRTNNRASSNRAASGRSQSARSNRGAGSGRDRPSTTDRFSVASNRGMATTQWALSTQPGSTMPDGAGVGSVSLQRALYRSDRYNQYPRSRRRVGGGAKHGLTPATVGAFLPGRMPLVKPSPRGGDRASGASSSSSAAAPAAASAADERKRLQSRGEGRGQQKNPPEQWQAPPVSPAGGEAARRVDGSRGALIDHFPSAATASAVGGAVVSPALDGDGGGGRRTHTASQKLADAATAIVAPLSLPRAAKKGAAADGDKGMTPLMRFRYTAAQLMGWQAKNSNPLAAANSASRSPNASPRGDEGDGADQLGGGGGGGGGGDQNGQSPKQGGDNANNEEHQLRVGDYVMPLVPVGHDGGLTGFELDMEGGEGVVHTIYQGKPKMDGMGFLTGEPGTVEALVRFETGAGWFNPRALHIVRRGPGGGESAPARLLASGRFRLNSPSPPSSPTSRFIRDIQKEHAEKDADGSGRSGRSLDGSGATALNQSVASSVGSRSSPPPEESRPSSPYKMLISDLVAGTYPGGFAAPGGSARQPGHSHASPFIGKQVPDFKFKRPIDALMFKAVVQSDVKLLGAALKEGADLTATNARGQTVFMLALERNLTEVLEWLGVK